MATAKTAIYRARRILEDIGPNYRWREKELIEFCDEGQKEIIKIRPDSTASLSDTVPIKWSDITTIDNIDSTLKIDDLFIDALVDYIVGRAHEKRAPFADPNKGKYHLERFYGALKS